MKLKLDDKKLHIRHAVERKGSVFHVNKARIPVGYHLSKRLGINKCPGINCEIHETCS